MDKITHYCPGDSSFGLTLAVETDIVYALQSAVLVLV